MSTTQRTTVLVVVPPRKPHGGFWALGRTRPGHAVHFPSGPTEIDVTPEELAELREEETKTFKDSDGKEQTVSFLTVVELDPATLAKRRADATARAAQEAADALEKAQEQAEKTAALAKESAAIAAATEKAEQGKGRK